MSALVHVAPVACAHCGLPVPDGRLRDDAPAFCCSGCEIVHAAIAEHGLERYYDLRRADAAAAEPSRTSDHTYGELDDSAFQRLHVTVGADGLARTALYLEDLRCTACVWLVESAPRCIDGVSEIRVDMGRSRADVVWDPERTPLSAVARYLDRVGHAPHPYRGMDRERQRRVEDRTLLIKLGVAGAALGNIMLLAVALYAGLFGGMSSHDTTMFRWISMFVAVPGLGYAATPFFATAIGALRARRLHLDLPLSIGIVAGLGWGAANVVRGVGEIYFDSLAMLVFLLLVSRWIVLRHQRRASSAAELLLSLTPTRAHRITDGVVTDVAIEAIVPGDLVSIRVGEVCPVDGELVEGASALDVGLLTGESNPVEVRPGDTVHAGTANVAAPIIIRATAVGEATRVGKLVATIEAMSSRKSPIERLVDRIAGRFVAVVTTVALATFVLWSLLASVSVGAEHAMALLVVTCPCALALATPLAVTVALGRAARRGILVKGADALERLATPGTIFVDKTGTLTMGKLAVVTWFGDVDAAVLASAVEAGSDHPIARALRAYAPTSRSAKNIREEIGRGIAGLVDGRLVIVGAPAWVRARISIDRHLLPDAIEYWIAELAERGETPIVVAIDGVAVAVAGLADPIRPDAGAALAKMMGLGWRVELLSGDDTRVVRRVGASLGFSPEQCTGNTSPEGKVAVVRAARERGPVLMVGDGVNDAAAMAAATAGIAVSGAAEIAIEAADVYLRSPSITTVADAIAGGRATLVTIKRNLRFSLVYNLAAGALAVAGLIHPLVAAAVMPLSSLTVLASSLRSRAFRSPS
ncbi:MAG: heavy metal translocating P-type ATPase [Kofleriaceae bacterium]